VQKVRKKQKQNISCSYFLSEGNKMYYTLETNWTKL